MPLRTSSLFAAVCLICTSTVFGQVHTTCTDCAEPACFAACSDEGCCGDNCCDDGCCGMDGCGSGFSCLTGCNTYFSVFGGGTELDDQYSFGPSRELNITYDDDHQIKNIKTVLYDKSEDEHNIVNYFSRTTALLTKRVSEGSIKDFPNWIW